LQTQHFTHVGSLAAQIFITIMLKEKGVMQTSRLAGVQLRKFRENVALKRLQAYMAAAVA